MLLRTLDCKNAIEKIKIIKCFIYNQKHVQNKILLNQATHNLLGKIVKFCFLEQHTVTP
jgi:hypothetical protein